MKITTFATETKEQREDREAVLFRIRKRHTDYRYRRITSGVRTTKQLWSR